MSIPERVRDYASLKTLVARWLDIETNPDAVAEVPQFVQFAENRINRLKLRIMERTSEPLKLTKGETVLPLPFDFNGMQYLDLYTGEPLVTAGQERPDPQNFVSTIYDISRPNRLLVMDETRPGYNRIEGNELHLFPYAPENPYYLVMGYWRKVPPLGEPVDPTDQTIYAKDVSEGGYAFEGNYTRNWLLDDSQDLYVYMSLVHGEGYARDQTQVNQWKERVAEIVEQLKTQDRAARHSGTAKAPLIFGGTP